MKILIVDDSLTHRKILMNCLSFIQLESIIEAKNGFEALQKLEGIDLVFTDWNMDEMDGINFAKAVRKNHISIPIIMISSNNSTFDLKEAFDAGITDYITKPFSIKDVKNIVNKYIVNKHLDESKKTEEIKLKNISLHENRTSVRYNCNFSIKHKISGSLVFNESYCENISIEGMKLLSAVLYKVDEVLDLDVHYLDPAMIPLSVKGLVKWCDKSFKDYDCYWVGVNFIDVSETQKIELEKLIWEEIV